jgi:rod shape-determining protein MreD
VIEVFVSRGVLISASALAALILSIGPLPIWLQAARPQWLALFIVFWTLQLPVRMGLRWAWLFGLLLDGVIGGVLGKHALALTTVAYATEVLRARLLLYTLPQQMTFIFVVTTLYQVQCLWVQSLGGHRTNDLMFLVGSLSSALVWPLLHSGNVHGRTIDGWKPPA